MGDTLWILSWLFLRSCRGKPSLWSGRVKNWSNRFWRVVSRFKLWLALLESAARRFTNGWNGFVVGVPPPWGTDPVGPFVRPGG